MKTLGVLTVLAVSFMVSTAQAQAWPLGERQFVAPAYGADGSEQCFTRTGGSGSAIAFAPCNPNDLNQKWLIEAPYADKTILRFRQGQLCIRPAFPSDPTTWLILGGCDSYDIFWTRGGSFLGLTTFKHSLTKKHLACETTLGPNLGGTLTWHEPYLTTSLAPYDNPLITIR